MVGALYQQTAEKGVCQVTVKHEREEICIGLSADSRLAIQMSQIGRKKCRRRERRSRGTRKINGGSVSPMAHVRGPHGLAEGMINRKLTSKRKESHIKRRSMEGVAKEKIERGELRRQ